MTAAWTRREMVAGALLMPAAAIARDVACVPDGYRTIQSCAQVCIDPRSAIECQSKLLFPDKPSLAGRVLVGAVLGGVVAFATGNVGMLRGVLIGGIAGGIVFGLEQFDRYMATRYRAPAEYLDQHYRYWQSDSVAMMHSAIVPALADQGQWLRQALDRVERGLPLDPDAARSYDESTARLVAVAENVVQTDTLYDTSIGRAEARVGGRTRRVSPELRQQNVRQSAIARNQRQMLSAQILPSLPYSAGRRRN